MGLDITEDAFQNTIEALQYFRSRENQFHPVCSLAFPKITEEELSQVTEKKRIFFFRDGLNIFESDGIFVQRKKPGIPFHADEQLDLTVETDSEESLPSSIDFSFESSMAQ